MLQKQGSSNRIRSTTDCSESGAEHSNQTALIHYAVTEVSGEVRRPIVTVLRPLGCAYV